jgi:hypothetical protein
MSPQHVSAVAKRALCKPDAVQTLFREAVHTLRRVPRKSHFAQECTQHTYGQQYTACVQTEPSSNPNSNKMDPNWPQNYLPTTCVIAQQYSSATLL